MLLENINFPVCIVHVTATGEEKFYSVRVYNTVVTTGLQVAAVFCVCPELPIYTRVWLVLVTSVCACITMQCVIWMQHCDEVIAQCYPEMADKTKAIFINSVIIKSDGVKLVKSEHRAILDHSMVG